MSEQGPMEFSADDPYYAAICYAQSHGAKDLKNHPGCWESQVDEGWFIALNGHKDPMLTSGGAGKGDVVHPIPVEPYTVYVEWNGWPAGILTPFGGTLAAGEAANPETFVAALAKNAGVTR